MKVLAEGQLVECITIPQSEYDALRARIAELTQGWEADRVELAATKAALTQINDIYRCISANKDLALSEPFTHTYVAGYKDAEGVFGDEVWLLREQLVRVKEEKEQMSSALSRCRADALEEAARVAHDRLVMMGYGNRAIDVQDAIRALQTTPPSAEPSMLVCSHCIPCAKTS